MCLLAQVVPETDRVAVIGDGKLGLLVAQLLVLQGLKSVTHFGRHQRKLDLVQGTTTQLVTEDTATSFAQVFNCCWPLQHNHDISLLSMCWCLDELHHDRNYRANWCAGV